MDKQCKWEDNKEYEYRKLTSKLSNEMVRGLDVIVKQTSVKIKNYIPAIKIFEKIIKELKKCKQDKYLSLYRFVNEYFLNGCNCYLSASILLDNTTKISNEDQKTKDIYTAQRLINEGNAWIEISKCKIAEAFEIGSNRKLS